jgi:hypothetical protein
MLRKLALPLFLVVMVGCQGPSTHMARQTTTPSGDESQAESKQSGDLVEDKEAPELAKEFKEDRKRAENRYMDTAKGKRNPGKVLVRVSGLVEKIHENDVYLKTGEGMPKVILRAKSLPKETGAAAKGAPAFVSRYDGKTIIIETDVTFGPGAGGKDKKD